MISPSPYIVEIRFTPREGARAGLLDLTLIDRGRQSVLEAGVTDLDLAGKSAELPSGRALLADDFVKRMRRGEALPEEHGLAFGRLLLSLLLADARIARAWNEIHARRTAAGRPMRILLDARSSPGAAWNVQSVPFELMADDHGFLFHDRGHALVRVVDASVAAAYEAERLDSQEPPETRRTGAAGPDSASTIKPRGALARGVLSWAVPVYAARSSPADAPSMEEAVRSWSEHVSAVPAGPDAAPLPTPSPHFRGRDDEVRACLERLASERLVSIVGLPGIGKTELAAVVAYRALHDGEHALESALWFPINGLTEVDALRARMALGLGLDPRRCKVDEDLARVIGGARTLIVFDGVEILLRDPLTRTRFQWFLNTLLAECEKLRFLVTTRKRMGDVIVPSGDVAVAKESSLELGPLPSPADRELFIMAGGPRLTALDLRSPELSALVSALLGHPRAILLAASLAGGRESLAELRARLVDDDAAGPPSPGSLFGVDEASEEGARAARYLRALHIVTERLRASDPGAAETLIWLGHLPSGLPEALLPYVLGEGAAEEGAALLRYHLLQRCELDRHVRLATPLATIALRPTEVLPEARRVELLRGTFAALGAWLTAPFDHPGSWRDRDRAVQQESNLAALVLAIPEPAPAEQAEALAKAAASAIIPFAQLMIRVNRPRAASEVCREAVRHIVALGAGTPLAAVLTALGDLFVRVERLEDAEQAYTHARPVYRVLGDNLSEASTLHALGDVFARTGRMLEAEGAYREARAIFRALGERLGEANALRGLGDVCLRADRLKEAEEVYVEALPIYKTLGERLGEASARQSLGDLFLRTDRLKEAEHELTRALKLYREIDEGIGEANTLQTLGDLFLRTDRLKEAEDAYTRALPIYRDIELPLGEANTLRSLGELYLRTDRLNEADATFRQALHTYRAQGDKLGKANTLQSLGKLALVRQDGEAAFGWFLAALRIHEALENRLGVGGDRGYLARAARVAGRPLRAAVLGGRALAALDRDDDRFGQLVAMRDLARSLAALGEQKGAVAAWFLAWVRAQAIDDPSGPSIAAMLVEVLQDFDPTAPPLAAMIAEHERHLAEALASCEARLTEAGEDPYGHLGG